MSWNFNRPNFIHVFKQGRRLIGDTGIVPLKKLGWGDGSAFIPPQYLENVIADLQCKNE